MKSLKNYLSNNSKKVLIFDFDETIVHLNLPWNIYSDELANRLTKVDKKLVNQLGSRSSFGLRDEMIKVFGNKVKEIVIDWSEEFEDKYLDGFRDNTNLIEYIKVLHESYSLFIWSSNTSKTIMSHLSRLGIYECFEKLVTSDLVDFLKPNPNGFDFIKSAQFKLEDYLMIGNSIYSDKGAADNAGIEFFHLTF